MRDRYVRRDGPFPEPMSVLWRMVTHLFEEPPSKFQVCYLDVLNSIISNRAPNAGKIQLSSCDVVEIIYIILKCKYTMALLNNSILEMLYIN